jgi:hypothetical protein
VAENARTVTIDLHPMHEQVRAHLEFLRTAGPTGDKEEREVLERALRVLATVDEQLKTIQCWHMGVRVIFKS